MKIKFRIFSNPIHALFFITTALLIFIVLLQPPIDADMWWHLKSGQTMWQQKTILTQDQFSFTKINQPWVNAFWISDLLLYFLVAIGGFPLLIVFIAVIGAITFLIIFFRSSGPFFIRSFVILLAAISVAPMWTARPQVFSFLLFALLNLWMEKRIQNRNPPLFLLPLFFIAWANIHGGYIWGFLLLLATIVGKSLDLLTHKRKDQVDIKSEIKELTLWTVISMMAVIINPNGIAIWKLPFYTVDVSIAVIQEWFSPNFHNLEMQPYLWIILLLIICFSLSEKKQSFVEIFKLLGFIYLAFIAQRNIPLSTIVISPIIIDSFSVIWLKRRRIKLSDSDRISFHLHPIRGSGFINALLIVLLFLAAVGRIYLQSSNLNIIKTYPYNAVKWIKENHPNGNMFNSYNWGGYLAYNLPLHPVFIDGRADLFGEKLINEWWDIAEGKEQARSLLDFYDINFLLIEPDWPIVDVLINYNWEVAFQDDISIILIRKFHK